MPRAERLMKAGWIAILVSITAACGLQPTRAHLPAACQTKFYPPKSSLPKQATDADYLRDLTRMAQQERDERNAHNACVDFLR